MRDALDCACLDQHFLPDLTPLGALPGLAVLLVEGEAFMPLFSSGFFIMPAFSPWLA